MTELQRSSENFAMQIIAIYIYIIYLFLQILGRALGGKIGRAQNGWDIGVRKITLSSSKLLPSMQPTSSFLKVIEIHRDEVCLISFYNIPHNLIIIKFSS